MSVTVQGTEGAIEPAEFSLDPRYYSDQDDKTPEVWPQSDRIRALLAQERHTRPERREFEDAVRRQLRTALLFQILSNIVRSAGSTGRLTMYLLLFPGEARDQTGLKDLNDKMLGYWTHQEFVAVRQRAIKEIFQQPNFVVVGQDYKTALFVTWEQNRQLFDERLHQLDKRLRDALLKVYLPRAEKDPTKRDAARKLRRTLESDPEYRFDWYYGTDSAQVGPSTTDVLSTGLVLLTQAMKAASVARYIAKGLSLTRRVVRPLGKRASSDRRADPRGKTFDVGEFLSVARAAPMIKDFMLKPASQQAGFHEYNTIYVNTVWTEAFLTKPRSSNRDVIRDVRKRELVPPPLPNIKYTFEAQREFLELWLVVLNLIDVVKDFLERELGGPVLRQHRTAVAVLDDLRDFEEPVEVARLERFLTQDLRGVTMAVLGTTSEFQFYAKAADYPARIIFMMDIRDLGVEVMLMYDTTNARIVEDHLTDRRLFEETIRSTDPVTALRRTTFESLQTTFHRYHDRVGRQGGSTEAAQAFNKATGPLGDFDDDVQIMLGGDELMVAAHPRFAKHVHQIVADVSETVLRQVRSARMGPSEIRMGIRVGVAFSYASEPKSRRSHQDAHYKAMLLAESYHGTLKKLERQHRRIERLLDVLDSNPAKRDDVMRYRRRLTALRLDKLFCRSQLGRAKTLPIRRLQPLVVALRAGNPPPGRELPPDLVDFEGVVVDAGQLEAEAKALEEAVRHRVGRDNVHIDPPPVRKVPLPKDKDKK